MLQICENQTVALNQNCPLTTTHHLLCLLPSSHLDSPAVRPHLRADPGRVSVIISLSSDHFKSSQLVGCEEEMWLPVKFWHRRLQTLNTRMPHVDLSQFRMTTFHLFEDGGQSRLKLTCLWQVRQRNAKTNKSCSVNVLFHALLWWWLDRINCQVKFSMSCLFFSCIPMS